MPDEQKDPVKTTDPTPVIPSSTSDPSPTPAATLPAIAPVPAADPAPALNESAPKITPEEYQEYKAWKDSQEKKDPEAAKASAPESAELIRLQTENIAMKQAIPPEAIDKYVRLAMTHQTEGKSIADSITAALADFPLPAVTVPGSAANPSLPPAKSADDVYLDSKYGKNPYFKK